MAKFDTTHLRKRLENLASKHQLEIRAINANDELSPVGKARAIERAKEESRGPDYAKLKQDFYTAVENKRVERNKKREPELTPREQLRLNAAEAKTFPNLHADDLKLNLQIEAMENVAARIERLEMMILAEKGEEFFREQLSGDDLTTLQMYNRALPYLPAKVRAPLEKQYAAKIEDLTKAKLSPLEQQEIEDFEKEVALFEYSLENFDMRGDYVDPRPQEQAEPTIITAVNPKLGVSHPAAKFARYKDRQGTPNES